MNRFGTDQQPSNAFNMYLTEISELIKYGQNWISKGLFINKSDINISDEKLCSNSTLHRGYYHPSPVFDLIVGNTKRGKLVSRRNSTANITHRYFFDNHGRLACIESISLSRISYRERLLYSENEITGITIDCNGNLSAVSKEYYDGERITYFALMNCVYTGTVCDCFNYHVEQYAYDNMGLQACTFVNVSPLSKNIIHKTYSFKRENGYLVSYSEASAQQQTTYSITKKRKS